MQNYRVGDSDSNGTIESAIGSVEGVARTLRIALEEKVGQRLLAIDPIIPWLIRHAGHIIIRCWVRPNGTTAHQMVKGRRSNAQSKKSGNPCGSGFQKRSRCLGSLKQDGKRASIWASSFGLVRIWCRQNGACFGFPLFDGGQ